MKHMKKKLTVVVLFCVMFLFAMPVMASNGTEKKTMKTPAQTVEHSITNQTVKASAAQLNDLKKLNEHNRLEMSGSGSGSCF